MALFVSTVNTVILSLHGHSDSVNLSEVFAGKIILTTLSAQY